MQAKTEWQLEQEIKELTEKLDAGTSYMYKEEVWRDSDRLAILKEELAELKSLEVK